MAKKTQADRLTLSIDRELKRRFDIVCRWKDLNMSEVAQKLFDEWVQKNAPPGLFDLERNPQEDDTPPASPGGKAKRSKEDKD
jgi:hypothetical protein